MLAGGASRRFGGVPKGLEQVGGRRMIDRVAASLARVTRQLVIAANEEEATHWLPGVPMVRDGHEHSGGLAGVEAALQWAGNRAAVVVAWDMPFVSPAVLQLLLETAAADADVIVPESQSPYGCEPFCALYAAQAREPLTRFLSQGAGAARTFLASVATRRVPLEAIRRLGDPATLLLSVNTPADLEHARRVAASG